MEVCATAEHDDWTQKIARRIVPAGCSRDPSLASHSAELDAAETVLHLRPCKPPLKSAPTIRPTAKN